MGSRVLTACSFRSKSIPQQVFHRCRSAEALRLFRVPAVYLTSAFLWFFSALLFRRINNLRRINPPEGFDSHPGHHFLFHSMSANSLFLWRTIVWSAKPQINRPLNSLLRAKRHLHFSPFPRRRVPRIQSLHHD